MNLTQEIQSQVTGLPTDLQVEILDFIKFVKQRRRVGRLSGQGKTQGNVGAVLDVLRSPAFPKAPAGNPAAMAATIQANRNAWND
jgi:hypothetical protein